MVYKVENTFGAIKVVQRNDNKWAVLDSQGAAIVPFGRYDWIDGFDSGLSRVKIGTQTNGQIASNVKWGIINEKGEEVLPVIYDNIWNFLGKNRFSTNVEKDGIKEKVYFHNLNPSLPVRGIKRHIYREEYCEESPNDYFNINDCFDYEGNFDFERLEDAIMDGEYVPKDR